MSALLAVERLDKRYGLVQAVSSVSLAFEAGRIHAVVGENGAGKSTLLKMAAGVVAPDAGVVRVDGRPLAPHTAREAILRGVGLVQQHFALVGALTALENVMLGSEPVGRFGALDTQAARARAEAVARDVGVRLAWETPVRAMGVGDRQRLEIVRTLVREARVVILDEPTAVLTPGEAQTLYATLRRLADGGRAVVVVTHRLDEVRDHADEASVMRHGRLVSTRAIRRGQAGLVAELARDVMGQEPPPAIERRTRAAGDVLLSVRDLRSGRSLRGATFDVRAGEVVGIAGVDGNGQRELVRALAGLDAPEHGSVAVRTVTVVHEDRLHEGLVPRATVRDNLVLGELARFTRFGLVDDEALDLEALARLERARIDRSKLDASAADLSGGNQQKVVVARAVARADRADVVVLSQPTRGVDLGSARAIHAEVLRVADAGKGVLVVSADLGELRAICDRILVMTRGRITADLPPDATDARFGEAMLGTGEAAA